MGRGRSGREASSCSGRNAGAGQFELPYRRTGITAMQSVDSYLSEIIAAITRLPPEDIPLTEADGAVLAADAVTNWPLPGFDNSAMDGYAVRAADVAGATAETPVTLPADPAIAARGTSPCSPAPAA